MRRFPPRGSIGMVGEVVQTCLVVVLIAAFFLMQNTTDDLNGKATAANKAATKASDDAVNNAAGIEKITGFLKNVCAVAPDKDLAEEGMLQPCRLAQQDRLDEVVPVAVPTDGTMTSAALNTYVDARVDRYLSTYKPKIAGISEAELRTRIRNLLVSDPALVGKKGDKGDPAAPITDAQVSQAVAAILAAKPPKAIRATEFDSEGCNLTISYTDGTSDTFGSLCGDKGDKGDKGDRGDPGAGGSNGNDGATGAPGRGIASIECRRDEADGPLAPGRLYVTYDRPDGNGDTVDVVQNATCDPQD